MTKSTFKDISFLGVLNLVAFHSQTKKYLEVISTPRVGKVKHARAFQISLKGSGRMPVGEGGILVRTGICLSGGKNFFKAKNNILQILNQN